MNRTYPGHRTPALLILLAGALSFGGALGALAQATPTAGIPEIPPPEACQVVPRELPLFPEGVGQRAPGTPEPFEAVPATPFALPSGAAPDAGTVDAVTATVREALACRNANDFLRAYALFTQNMIVELFGGPGTIDPEVQAAMAQEPQPLPRRARVALYSIDDVVSLPDGRVGVLVLTLNAQRAFRDYLIFARDAESGRWLIDESITLPAPEIAVAPATPVP
jgi:hypothetical protein